MKQKINTALMVLGLLLLLTASVIAGYSIAVDRMAGENAGDVLSQMKETGGTEDYLNHPDIPMPTERIDGRYYIGEVSIPDIDITLPVLSQYKYKDLDIAPCRYAGSAYTNDMVIAGHSYITHFRKIRSLSPGEEVKFTDTEGHTFTYAVSDVQTMDGNNVDEMLSGEWDLTLFTCTATHVNRCAVRCKLVE